MPNRNPGPSVKDKAMYEALRDEGNSKTEVGAHSVDAIRHR